MEHFIHHNGYLTVFITVALSGEFGLFAGVALARAGVVTLACVVAVGTVASIIGNIFYYCAGKILWNKWGLLKRSFGAKVEASSNAVRKYGAPLMVIARFFYGVRNIVPITLGLYGVGLGIFMLYNVIGAFIWSWVFVEAANLFSAHVTKMFAGFRVGIFGGIVTSALLVIIYFVIRKMVSNLQK